MEPNEKDIEDCYVNQRDLEATQYDYENKIRVLIIKHNKLVDIIKNIQVVHLTLKLER